jgi:uncharacterized protein (UPF0276 family)
LYEEATKLFGLVPTIIEWDERVPELAELEAESERARLRAQRSNAASPPATDAAAPEPP